MRQGYWSHWKYMCGRNFYGRSRLYVLYKTLKQYLQWQKYRRSNETLLVTCWKCDTEYRLSKSVYYYYDNTKCGRCYL